jgi:hypothetical protein
MKKILILSLFLTGLAFTSTAQTKFGVGGTYWGDLGVQGRAKFSVTDEIIAMPNVNLYFGNGTRISLDAHAGYNFAEVESMPIYGIGGLGYYRISDSGFSSSSLTITLGAGIDINENIYAELFWRNGLAKFFGSDIGINAGYYF